MIQVDDFTYILDRVAVLTWLIGGALELGGLLSAALWVYFVAVGVTAADFILHFHLHAYLLAWCCFALVMLVVLAATVHIRNLIAENVLISKETPTHGWLVPASDPTPANMCSHNMENPFEPEGGPPEGGPISQGIPLPQGALLVVLGNDSFWSTKDFIPFRLGDCTIMEIKRSREGLLISANVFAEDKNKIVQIKDNEFYLAPGEIFPDGRPDLSTLVVQDLKGKEALYVRYSNPSAVVIRGKFFCSDLSMSILRNGVVTLHQRETSKPIEWNCFGEGTGIAFNLNGGFTIGAP